MVYISAFVIGFAVAWPLVARAQSRFGDLLIDKDAQVSQFRRLLEDEVSTTVQDGEPDQIDQVEPEITSQSDGEVLGESTEAYSGPESLTVAVLGDSMVDVLQPDLPQLHSALRNYYSGADLQLFNFGVGASDLEYAVERLTNDYEYLGSKYPSVLSVKPDVLVIESFAYNNFGYEKSGLDKQWMLIGDIITKTKKLSPDTQIVLAATIGPNSTIYAKGVDGIEWNQAERLVRTETVRKYLENIINFANSQGYPIADAYHASIDSYGEGKPVYINAQDKLHPSGPGGELFCKKIADAIAELEF